MIITGKQLKNIIPNLIDTRVDSLRGFKSRADNIAAYMNDICPLYGIEDKVVLAAFVANVAHESGGFRQKEENLNYSAQRILATWPSRFKTLQDALPYARNPEKLANKVYGGRMGNRLPGDGWYFRGGGFIHLTGREMYFAYQKHTAFDTTENIANAVRTDDYWAMDSACWFFSKVKELIPVAKKGKFKSVCIRINGGLNGYDDRLKLYNRALTFLE